MRVCPAFFWRMTQRSHERREGERNDCELDTLVGPVANLAHIDKGEKMRPYLWERILATMHRMIL